MCCARPSSKGGRGGRAGSKSSTECSSGGSEDGDGESESDEEEEDTDGDGEGSVRGNEETTTKTKNENSNGIARANQKPARFTYIIYTNAVCVCAACCAPCHALPLLCIRVCCIPGMYQGVCSCMPPGEVIFAGCTCPRKRKSLNLIYTYIRIVA